LIASDKMHHFLSGPIPRSGQAWPGQGPGQGSSLDDLLCRLPPPLVADSHGHGGASFLAACQKCDLWDAATRRQSRLTDLRGWLLPRHRTAGRTERRLLALTADQAYSPRVIRFQADLLLR